jgi:hypothetical protein
MVIFKQVANFTITYRSQQLGFKIYGSAPTILPEKKTGCFYAETGKNTYLFIYEM